VALGVLDPEDGGGEAVLRGVGARVDDIGPDQRQRARQPREDAGMVGQREAGAGGVAASSGCRSMRISSVADAAQEPGEDGMGLGRRPCQ
jgi:hypothetical protein